MPPQFEIMLLAVLCAAACALPGTFLLLKRAAMSADAISHTVILGIVLGYLLTRSLSSPLLVVGAAAIGVLTVWLTDVLKGTGLVSQDAATGVIFPLFFALAIIIIARCASTIHLCADAVLMGEIAFAPLTRLWLWGRDFGPQALYTMLVLMALNLGCICLFFKELKLTSFDPVLASALGFSPVAFHYLIMSLSSITAVGSFQAVGAVLVVAFMTVPPATAYLLTDNLRVMTVLSCLIGALAGLFGTLAALALDLSISGCMAIFCGLFFLLAVLYSSLLAKKTEKY